MAGMFDDLFNSDKKLTDGIAMKDITPMDTNRPAGGDSNNDIGGKGLDSVITGMFQSIFGGEAPGGGKGGVEGVSTFGDFNPIAYVDGKIGSGDSGAKTLGKLLGSIFGAGG